MTSLLQLLLSYTTLTCYHIFPTSTGFIYPSGNVSQNTFSHLSYLLSGYFITVPEKELVQIMEELPSIEFVQEIITTMSPRVQQPQQAENSAFYTAQPFLHLFHSCCSHFHDVP